MTDITKIINNLIELNNELVEIEAILSILASIEHDLDIKYVNIIISDYTSRIKNIRQDFDKQIKALASVC